MKRIAPIIGVFILSFYSLAQNDKVTVSSTKEVKAENPIDGIYEFPDEPAEFISKMGSFQEYISIKVQYPSESIKMGEEGKAFVSFVIEKNGKVSNVAVMQSSNHVLLDNEAVRLIESSPKWKPARYKGKKVRSRLHIPINFTL